MWKCKKCKEDVEDQFDVCWNCGSDKMGNVALDTEEQKTLKEIKTEIAIENSRSKYPALRSIAGFYTLLAWIVGVVAIIAAILLGLKGGDLGILFSAIIIVIGAIIVLGLLAISESIMVLIDIEYNTRQKSKTK
jgi:hypothetical protein